MNKEQRTEYAKEYRRSGFGRLNDARYYAKNKEKILLKAKMKYRNKKNAIN